MRCSWVGIGAGRDDRHAPSACQRRGPGGRQPFRDAAVGCADERSGGARRYIRLAGIYGYSGPSCFSLQRFGHGGLISMALRTQTSVVPCAIVGAEEICPMIGGIKPLARLCSVPYFPVTPLFPLLDLLGMIPLPAKWYIEFGEPIRTEQYGTGSAEDPTPVFALPGQIRETHPASPGGGGDGARRGDGGGRRDLRRPRQPPLQYQAPRGPRSLRRPYDRPGSPGPPSPVRGRSPADLDPD
jgi:hypothetical protein